MSELVFRDADVRDLPTIVRLYTDDELGAKREDLSDPLPAGYLAAFREIDADPRHRLIVAELNNEIVGTLQLTFLPHLTHVGAERAQIEAVRIASSRRGERLGRELLEWAILEARKRGCAVVQLTTDAKRRDAHRFYEGLGFSPSHIGMKLDLQADT